MVEFERGARLVGMTDAAEKQKRSAGNARGRATKEAIVALAAEGFASRGFHGASLRAIAREAGLDHATLLHHFPSKTELLLAVLEWHDAQHAPAGIPEAPTAEQLVEGFRQAAERNRTTPGLVQLLSLMTAEAGAAEHPARPALRERHRVLVEIIASMIRLRRADGLAAEADLSPEIEAAQIVALWEGLQVYEALHPGELDVPALLERALNDAFGIGR